MDPKSGVWWKGESEERKEVNRTEVGDGVIGGREPLAPTSERVRVSDGPTKNPRNGPTPGPRRGCGSTRNQNGTPNVTRVGVDP